MDIIKYINENKKSSIYVFGAGDVAREVAYCLMSSIFSIEIKGFLVSDIKGYENRKLLGRPIMEYGCIKGLKDIIVIIAVLEKYRDVISNNLFEIGIGNQIVLTFESDEWCEIRGEYFGKKAKQERLKAFTWLEDAVEHTPKDVKMCKELKVFVARSTVDKELVEPFANRPWEVDIQVGAKLTDSRICEWNDCSGDNISEKNRQYCELTALYWIWKNGESEWLGLSHYRRRFMLDDNDIDGLLTSNIDAVFTTPVLNVPNVKFMYEKNHSASDWQIMKDAVEEICPEYVDAVNKMELSECYIPYNMFIMRKAFLNDYCEWLFPVLEYCENKIGQKDNTYQNRYVGFLAERLMTVYFIHNINKYNMVFAHKHFIETKV